MKRVDPLFFLPNEYFKVRQETTPKAPIKKLMYYAAFVYLIIGSSFIVIFVYQLTQPIENSRVDIMLDPHPSVRFKSQSLNPSSFFSGTHSIPKIEYSVRVRVG
jgi:hypothetical protein